MSTQPVGMGNPEAMGNTSEGYAELLLNKIQHAQEELKTSETNGLAEQAEGIRSQLDDLMDQYAQLCKERGIPNKLETTVN